MSLSSLPLSYCTNVHPGRTVDEVLVGVDRYTARVRQEFGEPLAAGLWLANSVIRELSAQPDLRDQFVARLACDGLSCHTLNAFPFGDFHGARVKEQVYLPDWSQDDRLRYTLLCAKFLAQVMPDETEGSISTAPLGFKELPHAPDFMDRCIEQLIVLSVELGRLHDRTGRLVRLAIEPEPLCVLETTAETVAFFKRLWEAAEVVGALSLVEQHVGVCFDVCHQAVEFEDVAEAVRELERAHVRINKVHITCALELLSPRDNIEGRRALAEYVEPRYLHQTLARTRSGSVLRYVDLDRQLTTEPPKEFLDADRWRIHFHVPVDADSLGPLNTTRADLKRALAAVAELPYAPHLEVETYTWNVLPDGRDRNLVDGLVRELAATRELLNNLAPP